MFGDATIVCFGYGHLDGFHTFGSERFTALLDLMREVLLCNPHARVLASSCMSPVLESASKACVEAAKAEPDKRQATLLSLRYKSEDEFLRVTLRMHWNTPYGAVPFVDSIKIRSDRFDVHSSADFWRSSMDMGLVRERLYRQIAKAGTLFEGSTYLRSAVAVMNSSLWMWYYSPVQGHILACTRIASYRRTDAVYEEVQRQFHAAMSHADRRTEALLVESLVHMGMSTC